MEAVTDEDASKLSKIELRKQKLSEYLAAKGRLKAPNPKPYLKEKPVAKKQAENNQKSKTTAEGKENRGINGTNIKEVKRAKAPDVGTSSKKVSGISSLAKAQTQPSSRSRNPHQEDSRVLSTKSNKTASIPTKAHNAEKTRSQRVLPKAEHPAQTSRTAVSNPSRSGPGRTETHVQSARPLSKKPTQTGVKSASGLTGRRPAMATETKLQRNDPKAHEKPTRLPRSSQSDPKPNPSDRSRETLFVDAAKSKSISRASTALSKPPQIPGNKEPAAVKRSRSCVLPRKTAAPPELQKTSIQTKPALQLQTPRSRLCPGAQGVRTAPVDGAKKPSAAQEERL
ncbi:cytoskeleton-associated protein 2-like [Puntigrus tetrazona]|nr:cytoskeleton-associated protein 2-like [Puntigrus tetrazona]